VEEDVDLAAGELGERLSGGLADGPDPSAALAEHDRLLAGPGDEDLLVDRRRAVRPFLEPLGLDRALVGSSA